MFLRLSSAGSPSGGEQKRRAKRVSSDTLLRSVAQVQTVLRDALTVALSARLRWSMSICVNLWRRSAPPFRQQLLEDAGGRADSASPADERECASGA